jgi:adenylate cyclase
MIRFLNNPRLQPLRLLSGLVLFSFALSHFVNHAAVLAGLDFANTVQDWRLLVSQSTAARIILPLAAVVHITLGLGRLVGRSTLRLPRWEWLQIATGIAVPILLIPHVVAITYFTNRIGFHYSYTSVAYLLWPAQALWQSSLLLIVWLHGCIGINYWLRTKRWYRGGQLWLVALAVAVPLLALTGFLAGAREAHAMFAEPAALAEARMALHWPDAVATGEMLNIRNMAWTIYGGIVGSVFALIGLRTVMLRRAPMVAVNYAGGPTVRSPLGMSLLEISRKHGIAHTSVCGGRARCSTCRVRVDLGADDLQPPNSTERATLQRIGAAANVRLACQLRPVSAISVTRLVTPSTNALPRIGHASPDADGVERQVAILFLDVRGFTKLSQDRLPFDIVFLLNQFFATVGAAIRAEDGWIDKYMGDGLLAVFGRHAGVAIGCQQALAAARAIDLALDELNQRLAAEIVEGIRIGIGIHAGPVVIGRIGDAESATDTVIGRTVNEASRLEALTKDHKCQLIVSRAVAEHAGLSFPVASRATIEVRGSDAKIDILIIDAARDLPQAPKLAAGSRQKTAKEPSQA